LVFIPVYFALRLIKTMLTCENAMTWEILVYLTLCRQPKQTHVNYCLCDSVMRLLAQMWWRALNSTTRPFFCCLLLTVTNRRWIYLQGGRWLIVCLSTIFYEALRYYKIPISNMKYGLEFNYDVKINFFMNIDWICETICAGGWNQLYTVMDRNE
jgi:hypothetical protein